MFLSGSQRGYTRNGNQWARGRFLMLTTLAVPKDLPISEWIAHNNANRGKVRGLVRYVRMSQLGHFMMGRLTIAGHKVSLSGTYGSDGLLLDVPAEVYALGVDLPQELYDMWNKGGGWNGAGSEGLSMREWAETTFPAKRR